MINRHVMTVVVYDPGQDARIPLLKVPEKHQYTIEKAYATADRATAADGTNHWALTLQNGGADQTGVVAIGSSVGGAEGWAANTPKTFSITDGLGGLSAGQWLMLAYDENGVVAPGLIAVTIEYVDGVGVTA